MAIRALIACPIKYKRLCQEIDSFWTYTKLLFREEKVLLKRVLKKHPMQGALFKHLASEDTVKGHYKDICGPQEMTNALTRMMTNIKNIWSKDTILLKLLDYLLLALLPLHLTGYTKKKKRKIAKTYSSYHYVRKGEHKFSLK